MRLILASRNKSKLDEIKNITGDFLPVFSMSELGFEEEIIEDGNSFFENALIKAEYVHKAFPKDWVLSDDSGLEVDALNGAPGIYSARYAGENATQEMLINKLLSELKDITFNERSARFHCSAVLITSKNEIHSTMGIVEGMIAFAPRGIHGFGYDPVFLPSALQSKLTFAEIDADLKNKLSHRGKAFLNMGYLIRYLLQGGSDEKRKYF